MRNMKRNILVVAPFFILLLFGLLLGDGKQSVVEIYGAAVAVVLWLIRLVYVHVNNRLLPRPIVMGWIAVFGVAMLSALFSDSRGYSLSWVIRLASGFLVYRFFLDSASPAFMEQFVSGVILFSGAASALFGISSFFPWFRSALPAMNLFSTIYGHNHLADILVFIAPMVMALREKTKGVLKWLLPVLYIVLLVSTLARGAWLVVGMYTLYVFTKRIVTEGLPKKAVFAFLVCVGGALFLAGNVWSKSAPPAFLYRQTGEARLGYLFQAIENVKEKPLLGSGPGTFSLISKHQAKIKQLESWFAHSEPFQIAAEMGLAGLLAFGWLFFSHVQQLRKSNDVARSSVGNVLMESVLLLLLYASFEFVLDFFVTWLLFWATLGLLIGVTISGQSHKGKTDFAVKLCIIAAMLFYGAWIASNTATLFTRRYDMAFYLAPFDTTSALVFLDPGVQRAPSGKATRLLLFFHRKNPDVLYALGQKMDSEGKDRGQSFSYAEQAAMADTQNMKYVLFYLSKVASLPPLAAGNKTILLLRRALPDRFAPQLDVLSQNEEIIGEALQRMFLYGQPPLKEGYTSFIYSLGLRLLYVRPVTTERLWILARDSYPDFAATHLELARFYQYVYKSNEKAQRVLSLCMRVPSARAQCAASQGPDLRPPGEFGEELE